MKRISAAFKLGAAAALLSAAGIAPALAGGYTSSITDTVKLDVQGAGVQSVRTGTSYAVSGDGVTVGHLGGLGTATSDVVGGTAYAGNSTPTLTTSKTVAPTTAGGAFSFAESAYAGDTVTTSAYTPSSGIIRPTVYGNSTVSTGGSAGALAGTLTGGGSVGTVTAGGAGTTGTLQRTVELSVFQ